MATKVIVEIDGIRHRLVKGRKPVDCRRKCSLHEVCGKAIDQPCSRLFDYFVLEK